MGLRTHRGFTLIELMITLAILATILTLTPHYGQSSTPSRQSPP